MNENQREHFKLILKAWRRELMEEVDRTVSHMKDEAANFPDPADRATQEEEFSLELRTRDRERKLIKKIDKTLVRVEEDDYGFCDQCGVEIGIRRLEARPTADLCVDCKTLDEIKERANYWRLISHARDQRLRPLGRMIDYLAMSALTRYRSLCSLPHRSTSLRLLVQCPSQLSAGPPRQRPMASAYGRSGPTPEKCPAPAIRYCSSWKVTGCVGMALCCTRAADWRAYAGGPGVSH